LSHYNHHRYLGKNI